MIGQAVSLAGKVNSGNDVFEKVVGIATVRLFTTKKNCSRIWLGPPSPKHKRIGPNVDYLLVGPGRVSITLTANPADTNTITLNDGITTYVFEFDNNSAVTGGNIAVPIGATATVTVNNLITAINANVPLFGINPPAAKDPSADIAVVLGVASISRVGANITLGAINEQGSTPIAVDNLIGYFEPTEDASLLFITAFNANDAIEVRLYE